MPAKSQAQKSFMSMVRAYKAGKLDTSKMSKDQVAKIKKAAKSISDKEASKFSKTKSDNLPRKVTEGASLKQLIEGMTFSSFLIVESDPGMETASVRSYIRSLPMYQELIKDPNTRSDAIRLAKELASDFGDEPLDQNGQNHILDRFDELAGEKLGSGTNLGDWKGEADFQRRKRAEADMENTIDQWNAATGEDAVTGAPVGRMNRGATHQQGKFDKARAEMAAFDKASSAEQVDRLAVAKNMAAAGAAPRGDKMRAAKAIFDAGFGSKKPSEIINDMMSKAGMSKAHATTYYYKFKKGAQQ